MSVFVDNALDLSGLAYLNQGRIVDRVAKDTVRALMGQPIPANHMDRQRPSHSQYRVDRLFVLV